MNATDLNGLQLPARDLARVRALVAAHVPGAEVWAYGSRVRGTGHAASDLDLLARNPADPTAATPGLAALRGALSESDLPIRVDLVDWARIPDASRRNILEAYVVVWPVA